MRVSRSLTIKQMAMVFGVAMVFIFVFIVIQLFHFVQQNRYATASEMESLARSVRAPLSSAILKGDIPQAETILQQMQTVGIVGRVDVVLPNQFQALHMRFMPERAVPQAIARLFELPVQISLPVWSMERPSNPQPLAYLVLQADSWRVYKFILRTISTLVITWLLLALVLTVSITWCVNRLMVHPLRALARALHDVPSKASLGHQLPLPKLHRDDEIGLLVRSYNRNQQVACQQYHEAVRQTTHYPVSDLPNKALLLALLDQSIASNQRGTLLALYSETLQEAATGMSEEQRDMLLLTLVARVRSVLDSNMILAQISAPEFVVLVPGGNNPGQAVTLARKIRAACNETLSIQSLHLRPSVSTGIAAVTPQSSGENALQHALSAAASARHQGKNQIQFFEPGQMALARQRLTDEQAVLSGLENQRFALWLQPQNAMDSGDLVSAEVLLRQRQPDGSWALPDGLIERIENSGAMETLESWVLAESCRLLAAWQRCGVTLPLSVNLSALQLLRDNMLDEVIALLRHYQIQPGTLIIEVTESRQIDDPEKAVALLQALRKAGVLIALDDFGVGHANLQRLHQMKDAPIDFLKIDKQFVESLPQDSRCVRAIIALAHSFGYRVVAEGVENEVQRQWLAQAGAEIAQGFLFDKALPPDEFAIRYLPEVKTGETL